MSEAKKINKKVQDLILKLDDPDSKTQIKAIQSLKIYGNEMAIEPLVALHVTSQNNAVKSEIESLLNTLKAENTQSAVIACLTNSDYELSHQMILSSIWNSSLDYSSYLNEIVETAINGDFMAAMECITIFENLETELSEEKILGPLLTLNQYLNDTNGEESPKNSLLTEVAVFLNRMNQSL
ncbi:MAG: hypothetical protein AB8B74_09130 [Crocinitomicaceae bacterium]